jgi:predicted neuraminidase
MKSICLALLWWFSISSALTQGLFIEKVLGPEVPHKYKHPAAITQLDNGDFLLAYHGGTGEYEADTAVWATRLEAGAKRWSAPYVIADTPFHGDGNPVIWQGPAGRVWLFYVVRYGKTWADSRIQCKVSGDGARTWSDSFMLAFEPGMMVRSHPIVLADGDYLLPIYHEQGNDPEQVSADCTSLFLRYHPETGAWTPTPPIRSRLGNIQPAVAQLTPEHLVCYCRRGGDYEGRPDGFMVRSESRDGGRTWSPGENAPFPNPNAAVEFLRLQSGHLLLIFNDSFTNRTPLTAALSTDAGKTFPYRRNIQEGRGDFAYPYAIQARDGKIHLVFTSQERSVINRAIFDERWLVETNPVKRADDAIHPGVRHVKVYGQPGRFGGWPANHGLWSWGDEILVGFGAGYHKDLGPERHNIDRERPEEHLLARSRNGGETWTIENPAEKGALIPTGQALHGVTPPGLQEKPWRRRRRPRANDKRRTVRVWDVSAQKETHLFSPDGEFLVSLAFSADDRALMAGCWRGPVKLWQLHGPSEAATFRGHSGWVGGLALLPGGPTLISAAADIRFWDVRTGHENALWLSSRAGAYGCVALSSDGRRLATGASNGRITIWDIASHQEVATLEGHKDTVGQLAFTPDGDHLISVSKDQVRVWRAASPSEADAATKKEARK